MAVASACVSLDWVVSVLVLAYALFVFLLKRELYLGPIFRLANASLLGIYVGEYIYMAYLRQYVNEEYVAIFIAMGAALVVLLLLHYLDNSVLILMLVVFVSSYGLIWWVMSLIAVFAGVAVAFIVWRNEIEYLTMCFFDSVVMAIVIAVTVVGIFTNFWPKNAPGGCSTEHVNIFVICENNCGSVLTDGGVDMSMWQWLIFIIGLATLRFLWVYWKVVCPDKEGKIKAAYESRHPRRQCCSRCQSEDQRDCCFLLCRCCAQSPTAFQDIATSNPATATKLRQRRGPESKRPAVADGEEEEEVDLELELALAVSEADQPQATTQG